MEGVVQSYRVKRVTVPRLSFWSRKWTDNSTIPVVLHARKFNLSGAKNAHYYLPKTKIFQSLQFSKVKTGVSTGDLLNRETASGHHHFTNHTAFLDSLCSATLA